MHQTVITKLICVVKLYNCCGNRNNKIKYRSNMDTLKSLNMLQESHIIYIGKLNEDK